MPPKKENDVKAKAEAEEVKAEGEERAEEIELIFFQPPEKAYSDVPFFAPKPAWEHATKEVPHEAHLTFHALQGNLFKHLYCEGGPEGNRDRMYILDKNGRFVTPERNMYAMHNMEKAAMDGRLFFRDMSNYLHQISLKKNEKDVFDLSISEKITEPVVPPRPKWYFIKNLLGKIFSYFNEMVEDYNKWKSFDEATTGFFSEYNANKVNNEAAQLKFAPAKAAPLVSEQPEVKEPEVKEPEVKQVEVEKVPEVPSRTVEELLETNPMNMTTKEFVTYLDALSKRGGEGPALKVILNPKGTLEEYYEAMAQELEGKVAGLILAGVDRENLLERHHKELEKQKPIIASMTQGLREFVRNYPERKNPEVVENFFAARAENKADMTMQVAVMNDMSMIQFNGMENYYEMVDAKNKQAQQSNQVQVQSGQVQQPIQVQQQPAQVQQSTQVQQPEPKNVGISNSHG